MNDIDQALTEAVAKALYDMNPDQDEWADYPEYISWWDASEDSKEIVRNEARVAIAAVRVHDAGLPCGHCTPNADEIACGCQIEERDDDPFIPCSVCGASVPGDYCVCDQRTGGQ